MAFDENQEATIKSLAYTEALRAAELVVAKHEQEGRMSDDYKSVPLIGGAENLKVLFDDQLRNAREGADGNRPWETLKLRTANDHATLSTRIANNNATIDHLANLIVVASGQAASLAGQVGATEGQQTVSPAGVGMAETMKGAVGVAAAGTAVSAEAIAASLGNLASALVPIITAAGGIVTAQTLAALLPVVITAAGGASTPSQTEAKP